MNPTIKALEEALSSLHLADKPVTNLRSVNYRDLRDQLLADWADRNANLIDVALRTLISLHQDVEGDMPQEIWAVMHITVNDLEQIGMYTQSIPTNPEKAQRYHRADTHINELTKRISDG